MFKTRNTETKTFTFGGRMRGNDGHVVKVEFVGTGRFEQVKVTRLGRDGRFVTKWHSAKVAHRMHTHLNAVFA